MDIKKSTLQDPITVTDLMLSFDHIEFNKAEKDAAAIIPDIKELRDAYRSFELKTPFNQKRFSDLINGDGANQVINEFREAVKKDLGVFKNPVSRVQTETTITTFASELHGPLGKVKKLFADFNKSHSYTLNPEDFKIREHDISISSEHLKKHYCTFISESGVEAYKQLHKLATCYNELMDLMDEKGIKLPYGYTIFDLFFSREVKGEDYRGGPVLGSKIEILLKNLSVFQ